MALSRTERQQNLVVAKELAKKLRFENKLSTKLKRYFKKIASLFAVIYLVNSQIIDVHDNNDDLKEILSKHYKDVSDEFSTHTRDHFGETVQDEDLVNDKVNLAISLNNQQQVADSTTQISTTTQNDINDSVSETIIAATIAGIALTTGQIAKQSKLKLNRKLSGRISTISTTETQNAAESTKYVEASALIDSEVIFTEGNIKISEADNKKTWHAILDEVTRPAHVEADGQTVGASDVFLVGGQRLRYPKDMSLGATLDNTINCRCTAVYSIEEESEKL